MFCREDFFYTSFFFSWRSLIEMSCTEQPLTHVNLTYLPKGSYLCIDFLTIGLIILLSWVGVLVGQIRFIFILHENVFVSP